MVRYKMNILGGSERIIFGTDWPASPADLSLQAILDFEIHKSFRKAGAIPPFTITTGPICLG